MNHFFTNLSWIDGASLFALFGGIVSIYGAYSEYKSKTVNERNKRALTASIIGTMIVVSTSFYQSYQGAEKDISVAADNIRRDSSIAAKVDSQSKIRVDTIYGAISNAFKKNQLALDTANDLIKRVLDSNRTVVNNFPEKEPLLQIDSNSVKLTRNRDSTYHVSVEFYSSYAASTNFKITLYILVKFVDGLEVPYIIPSSLDSTDVLGQDTPNQTGFTMNYKGPLQTILVYFKGTYSGTNKKSRTYKFNKIHNYEPETKLTKELVPSYRERNIQFINEALKRNGMKVII